MPCHRWFDFSITADGSVTMWCMDGDVQYPKDNVNDEHVLAIYNQPWLKGLRESLHNWKTVKAPCNQAMY